LEEESREQIPEEQPKVEEKEEEKVAEVVTPLEEEVFEPVVRRFAKERGLSEDFAQAALRLAKLLKVAGMDPYESLKKVSDYADSVLQQLSKIPDTETTKPLKDAIMARTMSQITEQLQETMLKGQKPVSSFDAKVRAIVDEFMPYFVAIRLIREASSMLEEKPREVQREIPIAAYSPPKESEDVKILREMLSKTYDILLNKAFEAKTPEEKSELKEILEKINDTLQELKEGGGIKKAVEELKAYSEGLEALGLPKPFEGLFPKELPPEHQVELKKLELERRKLELEDQREREKIRREKEAEREKMKMVLQMFKPLTERLGKHVGEAVEAGIEKIKEMPKGTKAFSYGMICPNCGETIEINLPKKLSGKELLEALPKKVKCPKCGQVFTKEEKKEKE
jgi:rRNA maturation protein Nop10